MTSLYGEGFVILWQYLKIIYTDVLLLFIIMNFSLTIFYIHDGLIYLIDIYNISIVINLRFKLIVYLFEINYLCLLFIYLVFLLLYKVLLSFLPLFKSMGIKPWCFFQKEILTPNCIVFHILFYSTFLL